MDSHHHHHHDGRSQALYKFEDVYAPRLLCDKTTRSCLALHPNGTVSQISYAELRDCHQRRMERLHHPHEQQENFNEEEEECIDNGHTVDEEDDAGSMMIHAPDEYGYQLSVFVGHDPDDEENMMAHYWIRACALEGEYLEGHNNAKHNHNYQDDDDEEEDEEDYEKENEAPPLKPYRYHPSQQQQHASSWSLSSLGVNNHNCNHNNNTMNIRGLAFIAGDLRELTMYDWKILQHCWRSQTLATKAKWRQSQQRQLQLWKERALFHHHSHILAADANQKVQSAVYIHALTNTCTEFYVSRQQLMLIAHPMNNSNPHYHHPQQQQQQQQHGLVQVEENYHNIINNNIDDHYEVFLHGNHPELCDAKYRKELAACKALTNFQKRNIHNHRHSQKKYDCDFRPDLSIPIVSEATLHTFVYIQAGATTKTTTTTTATQHNDSDDNADKDDSATSCLDDRLHHGNHHRHHRHHQQQQQQHGAEKKSKKKKRNALASQLLQMNVYGDAIVAKNNGFCLESISVGDVRVMLDRVQMTGRMCYHCQKFIPVVHNNHSHHRHTHNHRSHHHNHNRQVATATHQCPRCHSARYCSMACQEGDWENHESVCVVVMEDDEAV